MLECAALIGPLHGYAYSPDLLHLMIGLRFCTFTLAQENAARFCLPLRVPFQDARIPRIFYLACVMRGRIEHAADMLRVLFELVDECTHSELFGSREIRVRDSLFSHVAVSMFIALEYVSQQHVWSAIEACLFRTLLRAKRHATAALAIQVLQFVGGKYGTLSLSLSHC